jgi:alkanesulfonate monooxygenase SsuD/methylene tetrahydromethanopterin reductase-like flavin-dependent oxidoreductase (luciferase family)
MSDQRQLALNLFIYPGGHHEAAWRHKDSAADRILDITYYQELAQRAEASKFDAIFFADGPALADNVRYAQRFRFEPITWLAAIAAVTSRIGLIATASTTYTEPYNLARLFASLDHLSGGRAGWNIVTTRRQLRISACPIILRTASDMSAQGNSSTSSPDSGTAGKMKR